MRLKDAFHRLDDILRLNELLRLPKINDIKNKPVLQFDPVDKDAIEQIVRLIRLERARVLSDWRK